MTDLINLAALLCCGLSAGAVLATFDRVPRPRLWTETVCARAAVDRGSRTLPPPASPRYLAITTFAERVRVVYVFRAWGLR